jgi:hypothetical protein
MYFKSSSNLIFSLSHDQCLDESFPRIFKVVDLIRARILVQHDEEAKGESDDQDQVVAQALDQVHGDCVEHQTDASS